MDSANVKWINKSDCVKHCVICAVNRFVLLSPIYIKRTMCLL